MRVEHINPEALIKQAKALAWFTIVYNLLEGMVSIGIGLQDESISLMGFGFDSLIEVASGFIVLWRFAREQGNEKTLLSSQNLEIKATFAIGILFVLLATSMIAGSGIQLYRQSHPETTVPGIIVSIVSLSFMFFLWRKKLAIGTALGSTTIKSDAGCSLACIKLSFILLVGSLVYYFVPSLWWVDASAALVLAILVFKEGFEIIGNAKQGKVECCGCTHDVQTSKA